jgi:hypothetical protein
VQIAQLRFALAPVTGHPGAVIDKRQLLANQTVEQRGFAYIGSADNGHIQFHFISSKSNRSCVASLELTAILQHFPDRSNGADQTQNRSLPTAPK